MTGKLRNIKVFGDHDQNTIDQFHDIASRAKHVALMADGHLGYIMPIGGVAAYKGQVSVPSVGYDIACGNCAVKLDLHYSRLTPADISDIADEINCTLSFGIGGFNTSHDAPVDHSIFGRNDWNIIPPQYREPLRDKARAQLGTVGSGNHYVDIFHDEDGWIWIGVHCGSRKFGHTIANSFLALGQGGDWMDRAVEREVLLNMNTDIGLDYWLLMTLAGDYAYAGRLWIVNTVAKMLNAKLVEIVHNHHNFAWVEDHFGDKYIIHRKGATPAFPLQRSFVGGSMGDNAVILEGANYPGFKEGILHSNKNSQMIEEAKQLQRDALYSTVHGAGRVMSRSQAKGNKSRPPKILRAEMDIWMSGKGIQLRGGDVDEAPQAYRRLDDVLKAQGPTIKVLHTLTPLVVVMA